MTTFEKLLSPLKDFLELEGKEIDAKTGSRKLFFTNFTLTFLYAIRLHLEFCLNKMIVTEFICQKANSAERDFLIAICKKNITYIADRGYFSFDLANFILNQKAFIIFRVKKNILVKREQKLKITSLKQKMPVFFDGLVDEIIYFTNDPHQNKYRLISFAIAKTKFVICTNRFDLSTLEIAMFYAYRWQIELFFKFLKRTMNGIHLFNHSENGVNIQFYCFMIISLLQLRLKQSCQNNAQNCLELKKQMYKKNEDLLKNANQMSSQKWIQDINQVFHSSWKIGKHWLEDLRNLIIEHFNQDIIQFLAKNH